MPESPGAGGDGAVHGAVHGAAGRVDDRAVADCGISPKTLTDRLRDLEQHGLVKRVSYAEIPPRVEYTLTQAGRTLEPVIGALAAWGASTAAVTSQA